MHHLASVKRMSSGLFILSCLRTPLQLNTSIPPPKLSFILLTWWLLWAYFHHYVVSYRCTNVLMDQLKTVVVLIIGMILAFPFLLKGQTTTQSPTATTPITAAVVYTGCKHAEQNSPPSVGAGCVHICGDQIVTYFNSLCGIQSGRKRSALGMVSKIYIWTILIPHLPHAQLFHMQIFALLFSNRRRNYLRSECVGTYFTTPFRPLWE